MAFMTTHARLVAWQLFGTSVLVLRRWLVTAQHMLAGSSGWALRFDGYDDLVTLHERMPREPPMTIELWVKPADVADGLGQNIVKFNKYGAILSRTSSVGGRNLFQISSNGQEVWHQEQNVYGISTDDVKPSSASGRLYHFAIVYRRWNMTVYIDGKEAHFQDISQSNFQQDVSPLSWMLGSRYDYVGGDWLTDVRPFGGYLDEMRWWKISRTAADIKQYMYRPLQPGAVGLLRQWQFDEGKGTGDHITFVLGGGDLSKQPLWVPSPVKGVGGPVAIATSAAAGPQSVQICAVLYSNETVTSVNAAFDSQALLGTLEPVSSFTLQQIAADADEVFGFDGRCFCGNATYTPAAAGFEHIPFSVFAKLSSGGVLVASQNVSVFVKRNSPPVAGNAKAVQTNGKDNYVSLGSWGVAENFTLGVWVKTHRLVEDSFIVSKHSSDGSNLFLFGFDQGKYLIRIDCRMGCHGNQKLGRITFPEEKENELVFDTNKTAQEIMDTRGEAQHLSLTLECMTRGDAFTSSRARVRLYKNGELIGDTSNFTACLSSPLDPNYYNYRDWKNRPTPWEMGSEYDAGKFGEHLQGVAVKPSNFLSATFDGLIFWNRTLTPSEIVQLYKGGDLPHPEDIAAQYNFDLDHPSDCLPMKMVKHVTDCYPLNEAFGRTKRAKYFPWTNSLINGARHVPSPFYLLRGSPLHRALPVGECIMVTLQAADPDGDDVEFKLVGGSSSSYSLTSGEQLEFCDVVKSGRRDVEVQFDVCDSQGACASNTSGYGKVVFHILPFGPSIKAFQYLRQTSVLRVVFSEGTNQPPVSNAQEINAFLSFQPKVDVLLGQWEPGGSSLRLVIPSTNPLFSGEGLPALSIQILKAGELRDAEETVFPSTSSYDFLTIGDCPLGTFLPPGKVDCQPCAFGYVLRNTNCSMCMPGKYFVDAALNRCEECPEGCRCDGGPHPPVSNAGYYMVNYAFPQKCTIVQGSDRTSVCLGNMPYAKQHLSCAVGHVGPLCAACDIHYSRSHLDAECHTCGIDTAGDVVGVLVILNQILLWTALKTLLLGYLAFADIREHDNLSPILVRILTHWMAVCSVTKPAIVSLVSPWSSDAEPDAPEANVIPLRLQRAMNTVFFHTEFLTAHTDPQARLSCLADYFGATTSTKIMMQLCWWLCLPILVGMWVVILLLFMAKCLFPIFGKDDASRDRQSSSSNSLNAERVFLEGRSFYAVLHGSRAFLMLSLYFEWVEIATRTLSGATCMSLYSSQDDFRRVWVGDTRESCFEVKRTGMVVAVIIVWFLGFPLFLVLVIYHRRRRLHHLHAEEIHGDHNHKHARVHSRAEIARLFGFFFRGLEERFWWWDLVVKRLDMLVVFLIAYSSLIADNGSKLLVYLIIAGTAWVTHATARPYLDFQCMILDYLEEHAFFTRFFTIASLVLAMAFSGTDLYEFALSTVVLALCADVLFFLEVVYYVFMINSHRVAKKIDAICAQKGDQSKVHGFGLKLGRFLSKAHREKKLIAESSLHIVWCGPGKELIISPGKLPLIGQETYICHGQLGLVSDNSGRVQDVYLDGMAHTRSIKKGWRILEVDGAKYSIAGLDRAEEKRSDYQVTFQTGPDNVSRNMCRKVLWWCSRFENKYQWLYCLLSFQSITRVFFTAGLGGLGSPFQLNDVICMLAVAVKQARRGTPRHIISDSKDLDYLLETAKTVVQQPFLGPHVFTGNGTATNETPCHFVCGDDLQRLLLFLDELTKREVDDLVVNARKILSGANLEACHPSAPKPTPNHCQVESGAFEPMENQDQFDTVSNGPIHASAAAQEVPLHDEISRQTSHASAAAEEVGEQVQVNTQTQTEDGSTYNNWFHEAHFAHALVNEHVQVDTQTQTEDGSTYESRLHEAPLGVTFGKRIEELEQREFHRVSELSHLLHQERNKLTKMEKLMRKHANNEDKLRKEVRALSETVCQLRDWKDKPDREVNV